MRTRVTELLCQAALVASLTTVAACWGAPPLERTGGPLSVSLVTDTPTGRPLVRVSGLSSAELAALSDAALLPDALARLVSIQVPDAGDIAVATRYTITSTSLDLDPVYALEPGRSYLVRLDAAKLPLPRSESPLLVTTLTVPAATIGAATWVSGIFPSSSQWPENTLRFYLHFSGPMSDTSAVGHVRLVNDAGEDIAEVLLDIDVDLWNTGYTRRTVFFDPGRVKRGIRPNRELGRALVAGRRYAILVSASWKDAAGRPLAREFRHEFTAIPAVEAAVEPAAWSIGAISTGTRDPLVVTFPWSLDEGLLRRALGVSSSDGNVIDGDIIIGDHEQQWTFVPARPWSEGPHSLVILTLLEDPAGNKVGEPFEFEMFGQPAPDVERVSLPIPRKSVSASR